MLITGNGTRGWSLMSMPITTTLTGRTEHSVRLRLPGVRIHPLWAYQSVRANMEQTSVRIGLDHYPIPPRRLAAVGDHVQGVVRRADVAEPVRGPDYGPDA